MVGCIESFLTVEVVSDLSEDYSEGLDSLYLASIGFGTPAQVTLLAVDSKFTSLPLAS